MSGFIHPDGSVEEMTELFTARQLLSQPVVRSAVTISDRIGRAPEMLAVGALVLFLAADLLRRRGRGADRGIVLAPGRPAAPPAQPKETRAEQ